MLRSLYSRLGSQPVVEILPFRDTTVIQYMRRRGRKSLETFTIPKRTCRYCQTLGLGKKGKGLRDPRQLKAFEELPVDCA